MPEITIRLFQHGDANSFRELNEAWISKFFRLEDPDRIQLAQPEIILRAGGQIIMALAGIMFESNQFQLRPDLYWCELLTELGVGLLIDGSIPDDLALMTEARSSAV